jgi:hypothetical protein
MPAPGKYSLSRGEVMMYLALAGLNRGRAAQLAGVSRPTFFRLLRIYRVRAPKATAKLSVSVVENIRAFLGKRPRHELAKENGVHVRTIDKIANYETWYQVDV